MTASLKDVPGWFIHPNGDRLYVYDAEKSDKPDVGMSHGFVHYGLSEKGVDRTGYCGTTFFENNFELVSEERTNSEWNPPETAPYDTEFLGLLDNGWIIKIGATADPDNWLFKWWRTISFPVPIEHTHTEPDGTPCDWSDAGCQLLAGWMPLPKGDLELINAKRRQRNTNEFKEL